MKKLFSLKQHLHGSAPAIFSWQPNGNCLVSVGERQRNMYMFDRRGVQINEIKLRSTTKVIGLEWDKDGEILAILQEGDTYVQLLHMATEEMEVLETNNKDCSWLGWSKVGPQLAIGSGRGHLVMYNKSTLKKDTSVQKHTKRVNGGAWSDGNWLALSGDDKLVTVSTAEGDTKDQETCKQDVTQIRFANEHFPRGARAFSAVVGGNKLLLHTNTNGSEQYQSMELAFQQKYQNIRDHHWFTNGHQEGHICVGFDTGYVVVICAQSGDQIDELAHYRYHKNGLDAILLHKLLGRLATAGEGQLKMVSMKEKVTEWSELKSDRTEIMPENSRVVQMHWSDDSQLFTVGTNVGTVTCYLTKVANLAAACGSRLCYLTSLCELTIVDASVDKGPKVMLQTDVEPSFLALGPDHCAAGMNNRIWFYSCSTQLQIQLVNEHEYVGTVETASLNATHVAVLVEGRVFMHAIQDAGDSLIFPKEESAKITCCTLAGPYLIYADQVGHIVYVVEGTIANEYQHSDPIRQIFPNASGTRVVVQDTTSAWYLYNPVNDDIISISLPNNTEKVLWDVADGTVLVGVGQDQMRSFIYTQTGLGGPTVKELGRLEQAPDGSLCGNPSLVGIGPQPTSFPKGDAVVLYDGKVLCQQQSGELTGVKLESHKHLADESKAKNAFLQNMALNRFHAAFVLARELRQPDAWRALGHRALECLDVSNAKKAYRMVPSPGMVQWLDAHSSVEDKLLLSAHIAALFKYFNEAQAMFLSSSSPEKALDMHVDLLQWDDALKLASTVAPHREPGILLQLAMQLESRGEADRALQQFRRAHERSTSEVHARNCLEGLARCSIRLGDLTQGLPLVRQLVQQGMTALCKECAQILEDMKQFQEAAELHDLGGAYERAASLYIKALNFEAAGPLMAKITSPKLQLQYAKAKESRHAYADALRAYAAAGDQESVIRLQLQKLNQAQEALNSVRASRCAVSAQLCAEFCQGKGDIEGAVEFFVLAKQEDKAFKLAEKHDCMHVYERGLGGEGTTEQHLAVARFYERRSLFAESAEHYAITGDYQTALRYYLKVGESAIDRAIEVVGTARSDALTNTLIDYLMGEADQVPKDPNYVYRLHKALGNYVQAAQTAVLIAKQEQDMGNYRVAHDLLRVTTRDLQQEKMQVPQDVSRQLCLIHSYIVVKRLVKAGNHLNAAQMLIRVGDAIRSFPTHAVQILTSAVIECGRVGLKASGYKFACELMKPQYRADVAEAYKKKIEHVVRKQKDRTDEIEPVRTPCPYCATPVVDTELKCDNCQNILPYCILSGLHMLKDDWSRCPKCRFPACYNAFREHVTTDPCPMCGERIELKDVVQVKDVKAVEDAEE